MYSCVQSITHEAQPGQPRELLGRVMGALLFATHSVAPLSTLVIGAAVTRFGPRRRVPGKWGGAAARGHGRTDPV
jgi:hypothetical protein